MIEVQLTQSVPLFATLFDGAVDKFVRARVLNGSGVEVAGSPFSMPHLANGVYLSSSFVPSSIGLYVAEVVVYNDAGFTQINIDYAKGEETYLISERITKTAQIITDIDAAKTEIINTVDLGDGRAI